MRLAGVRRPDSFYRPDGKIYTVRFNNPDNNLQN
jgi:hypothetical protein